MKTGRFVSLAAAVFGLDMTVKQYVEETMKPGQEREAAGGKVVLRKVYNKGAMLNLLEDHTELLKTLSAGIGAATLLYDGALLKKKHRTLRKTGMMLFTGGAFSNIFDRLVRGKVIDYIGFRTRWPKLTAITYNIGDFAIFLGMALTALTTRKRTPSPDRG